METRLSSLLSQCNLVFFYKFYVQVLRLMHHWSEKALENFCSASIHVESNLNIIAIISLEPKFAGQEMVF